MCACALCYDYFGHVSVSTCTVGPRRSYDLAHGGWGWGVLVTWPNREVTLGSGRGQLDKVMAVFSKLLKGLPGVNPKAVVAVVSLSAGVMFYVNRRIHDARY